jgi:hypothetical protein
MFQAYYRLESSPSRYVGSTDDASALAWNAGLFEGPAIHDEAPNTPQCINFSVL